jgi:hypothetical protein
MTATATAPAAHVDEIHGNPLALKIAKIAASVTGRVAKDGTNNFHGYRYSTDTAIVEAIRDTMNALGVAIIPSVLPESISVQPVGEKGELLTTLVMQFTVIDGESGIAIVANYPGAGTDKADKGVYKAVTGATKYFLQKLFNIPTGDDPEKDTHSHAPAPAPQARPQQPAPAPAPQASAQQMAPRPASQPAKPTPTPVANGVTLVKDVKVVASGTNTRGPWTKYGVTFHDGRQGSTFSESLAEQALTARDSGQPVRPDLKPNPSKPQYFDLHALDIVITRPTVKPGVLDNELPEAGK